MNPTLMRLAALAALLLVFGAGYAAGQRQPPVENAGYAATLLRSIDLTKEFDSASGRTLRMRRITLQPGGALAVHDHVGRPALTYLLQGQLTYHREGSPDVVINPGEGAAEGRTTTHWAESTGTVPAVWIGVDIIKP